ncbi:ATP-dependent DNA helicase DinG [Pseudoalteromonas spongiae]|uniref:ATP-dependent DNA helicase DinG n=1 Tax=Pseudoalteromonas spongiae TaxID=298657 RepID=UPI003736E608
MLADSLKKTIRTIHTNIAAKLPDYRSRPSQNYLVAEIAKTLAGNYHRTERIAVIEAGTGTGKSLAYCIGAIPYAKQHKKNLIISTATVALQEQLINKELPFFAKNSGIEISFELAKGRQRYVCAERLYNAFVDDPSQLNFLATTDAPLNEKEQDSLKQLQAAYKKGTWQGDRDTWPKVISDNVWRLIQSDKHSCQRQLASHAHCPFHSARDRLAKADVIIVNHSLLLADLELGGGVILPEPADSIYVIDEAHHLPQVARDFSSASTTLVATLEWLDKLAKFNQKMANAISSTRATGLNFKLADAINDSAKDLKNVKTFFADNYFEFNEDNVHRFEQGQLPKGISNWVKDLKQSSNNMLKFLTKMHDALTLDLSDGDVSKKVAEPLLSESGHYLTRLDGFAKLWGNLSIEQSNPPHARWLKQLEYKNHVDYLLADCPIQVGYYLHDKLWQECAGAVLCSATLSALGSFDHFAFEAGLKPIEGVKYIKAQSPFDYKENAVLTIPNISKEPNHKEFSDELIKTLPNYIKKDQANLVLFASYWQMNQVAEGLRKKGFSLLLQGEASRDALLTLHRDKVKNGKGSILFGTQSFSEGLDLAGDLLTNLIITKIPFAVPTSPIEQAQSEYIETKGGNPFLSITVPEAAKKLVQSCGRLLRKESDRGEITILDRRLVTKRYGKAMLDSLPPFKRKIEY